jgi:hypothetical protein
MSGRESRARTSSKAFKQNKSLTVLSHGWNKAQASVCLLVCVLATKELAKSHDLSRRSQVDKALLNGLPRQKRIIERRKEEGLDCKTLGEVNMR